MAITLITGNTPPAGGISTVVVVLPNAGTSIDDLLFIAVESANETIATPSGWTQVTNSPQSIGTAATAGGVRLALFYKWVTVAGAQADVTLADSGNHTVGFSFGFRGVDKATPIEASAGGTVTANASLSFPAVTTLTNGACVVNVFGNDRDLASSANISAWTNANLESITELADTTISNGVGGGLGVAYGIKTTAGSTGNTTATNAVAVNGCYLTVALKPAVLAIVSVDTLAYTDTLNAVGLLASRKLSTDALTFTESLADVNLTYTVAGALTLVVDSLSFTQTTNAFGATTTRLLSVATNAYVNTSNLAGTLLARALPTSVNSYSDTLNAVGLISNRQLAVATISYDDTLNTVGFSRTFLLLVETNAYSVTAQPLGAIQSNRLLVAINEYDVFGLGVTPRKELVLQVSPLSYSISNSAVGFAGQLSLAVAPLSYTVTRPTVNFALTAGFTSQIFIGANQVTKIHLGGTEITRVHLGSVRIF